jgi:hypothetical protein
MSLSGLSAKTDFKFDGRAYPRGRRAHFDAVNSKGALPMTSETSPPGKPFDAAYYASRFKADLSQLKAFPKNDEEFPMGNAVDPEGDRVLYDFFGNLSVLLVSVRAGNLERARAAADALELEVMVESSAGARRPGRLNMLDDLRHLLNAAQSGDETAARAAAQDLARDVKQSLDKPRGHPAPDPAATPGEPDLDATAAAYDALMAYIGGDAQSAA